MSEDKFLPLSDEWYTPEQRRQIALNAEQYKKWFQVGRRISAERRRTEPGRRSTDGTDGDDRDDGNGR